MAFAEPVENTILDTQFRNVDSLAMGLFTTQPTETSSGIELPVQDGYIRQVMAPLLFTTASGGQTFFTNLITFTATAPWSGPVEGMAIFDQDSMGIRTCQVVFSDPLTVDSGESIVIPPEGLVFSVRSC